MQRTPFWVQSCDYIQVQKGTGLGQIKFCPLGKNSRIWVQKGTHPFRGVPLSHRPIAALVPQLGADACC